jgi:TetR/AcrR family transcriptional regulator, regulator of cefoperazone and chloramphenicol sensitivity
MDNQATGGEATRRALVEAALRLFGERGYDSVSTREIAEAASANIGSIAYHFNGKAGLRLAVAEFVAEGIATTAAPAIAAAPLPSDPAVALGALELAVERFARFLVTSREASVFAAFIIREVMQPGEIVDYLYGTLIERAHRRLCDLFAVATGREAESVEVKAAVFSMLGQILYFRIARPIVLKRMAWDDIGSAEADRLVAVFKTNLKGLIEAHRKG